jgi:hypothetical protein
MHTLEKYTIKLFFTDFYFWTFANNSTARLPDPSPRCRTPKKSGRAWVRQVYGPFARIRGYNSAGYLSLLYLADSPWAACVAPARIRAPWPPSRQPSTSMRPAASRGLVVVALIAANPAAVALDNVRILLLAIHTRAPRPRRRPPASILIECAPRCVRPRSCTRGQTSGAGPRQGPGQGLGRVRGSGRVL